MRRWLDTWQFWTGVAYFALAALVVGLFVVNEHARNAANRAVREQAIRIADMRAAANSDYTLCITGRVQLARVDRFLRGVQGLGDILYLNALEVHRVTPSGTPTYAAQVSNLRRLRAVAADVAGISFPIPTKATCAARRQAALISPPPGG